MVDIVRPFHFARAIMPLDGVQILRDGEVELQRNPVNDDETVGRDDDDMLFHGEYPFWLEFHDEAQGIVGWQGAEGLRRERVGVPAVGDGMPVCGGRDSMRVAVVDEAVAMCVRADGVGVAGVRDAVSVCP